ncbi:MAG TPA: ammonia-forming cytochrome c nitrite reductase subunit c552 [Myxococcota bacterium]|nr:ammonia-forming cytochrome c nitrite reductase subunit c552 [Myxococcota bacterium]HOC99999.1 ammonia-forming cytochrome c nitrite reductase subunit c552 [Myxococcota bacterium]HOH76908.1 ammonia-forming cytochrome c nitrite reductase subunit c552 [Myxococcota bacterium]HPV03105.1 ammonia-forming cytochrome c nitrite reductase subunit c552 [Myxococcota bacterium]
MEKKLKLQIAAYAVVAVVTAVATVIIAALLVNIFDRKQEAKNPFLKVVEVTEDDVDPAKWGMNWPRQYDGYLRTSEPTATKYGGGGVGPEGGLPPQKAERDPWLTRVFAGYLFAVDYRDRRGHAFMLEDQEITKRNVPGEDKQSGNCLHCHSSIMPLYRDLGEKELPEADKYDQEHKGLELVSQMGYWDAHAMLEKTTGGKAHPVSCVDCHDPESMELRVTRPGFIGGIRKLAESDSPVPHLSSIDAWRRGNRDKPYDPNTDGTRQEMRSFVCGQCHVEYFCGKGMTLFFPWDKGLKVEEIESMYNGMQVQGKGFKDWVHAETGMPVLKAQHPEFEIWSQGIHARSGVGCADCHMPYKREGALKVSEHWVRSPLLGLNRSCATCHPYGDQELKDRVEAIQDRHFALMTRAGESAVAMLDAIVALKKTYTDQAWADAILADPQVRKIAELQRAAQWRLDFVAAENSMGFHAPQETARILAESIDMSRQAQVLAASLLPPPPPVETAAVEPAAAPQPEDRAN